MVRVKSMPSKLSLRWSPLRGSSNGKIPLLAFSFAPIDALTSASASLPEKSCMAFSVDSTLLAAMKSRARFKFSSGLSKNDFLALSPLKQYALPSLSVQVVVQSVITSRPSATPSVHCPPNCTCDVGVTASAAIAPGVLASNEMSAVQRVACHALDFISEDSQD